MTNKELITEFYTAFANGDTQKMKACYADNIQFEDPAFGVLKGEKAGYMWEMLVKRSKGDLDVKFSDIIVNGNQGSAKWVATYIYSDTKRKVVNHISAKFEFEDGKIIKHTDDFDLWKWTKQALGFLGYLLGWSSFMKNKIQSQTTMLLSNYIKKQ